MIALRLVDSRPRAACASIVDFVGPYSVLGDKRSDDLDAGSRFTVINPSRFPRRPAVQPRSFVAWR